MSPFMQSYSFSQHCFDTATCLTNKNSLLVILRKQCSRSMKKVVAISSISSIGICWISQFMVSSKLTETLKWSALHFFMCSFSSFGDRCLFLSLSSSACLPRATMLSMLRFLHCFLFGWQFGSTNSRNSFLENKVNKTTTMMIHFRSLCFTTRTKMFCTARTKS